MPRSDEPLIEKVPFDVYAMMLILAFLATYGAIYFSYRHLNEEWYANEHWVPPEDNPEGQPVPPKKHPGYLTRFNSEDERNFLERNLPYYSDTAERPRNFEPQVTELDLADYVLATDLVTGTPLKQPPDFTPYPTWLNPLVNPINPEFGFDNTVNVPAEVLMQFAAEYIAQDPLATQDDAPAGAAPARVQPQPEPPPPEQAVENEE